MVSFWGSPVSSTIGNRLCSSRDRERSRSRLTRFGQGSTILPRENVSCGAAERPAIEKNADRILLARNSLCFTILLSLKPRVDSV